MKRLIDNLTYRWSCDRQRVLLTAAASAALFALGLNLHENQHPYLGQSEPVVQKAWVQVGLLILSVALSLLAGQLLAKKNDSPIRDDKPTTLATRGSFCSWHIGIRRTGLVFTWAGDREIKKEKIEGGGKGGDDPEQDVYYEGGMHVIGIGPMWALHGIVQSGKTIYSGPITRESHPSGTRVDLGKEGSFKIYWGEVDQPINTFLGNANRIGVSSRWPYFCYIQWDKKRMGPSPNWPILDYVFERRPHEESATLLTSSQSWYDPQLTLDGPTHSIDAANANANELVGYLEIQGDVLTHIYEPTTFVELTGTGLPNGTYEVLKSETNRVQIGVNQNGFPIYRNDTRIFLQDGTAGATGGGTIQSYSEDTSDGANVAHMTEELLFAPFPQGCALDPAGFEPWDITSLDALGAEAEADSWRHGILATEGETCEALLANILQDHGTMLPIDTANGNMKFQRVRFPSGTLPNYVEDIWADQLPEIETVHRELTDKVVFTFTDRDNLYGDMTIAVDDDGQASRNHNQRARKVPLVSTVHFDTAAALSELRSPEELSNGNGEFRLDASREARELIPGEAIIADGFDEVLRVTAVGVDPLSERVSLKVIPDFYGARKTDFVTNPGQGPGTPLDPQPDLAVTWLEVPEQVLGGLGNQQTILVPHIRAHDQISFTSLHLSEDDSTYTLWGTESFVQTGGTLQTALAADGPTYLAQGPVYDELGPDNASLTQDLSADLTNWGLGRQLAVIASSVGVEICFLQRATIVAASQRRLDGLLRARYGTRKLAHPAGASVFIFDVDAITPVQDLLLVPDGDLYVKSQPGTSAGQVLLSAVVPVGDLLYGKGQVPMPPDYVQVRAPFLNVPAFQTGDDISISWALQTGTPSTGAGGQPAGNGISAAVIPGTVQIELLTPGDVVQLTTSAPAGDTSYTITNAALVAAFGTEPTSFKVRISHVANGYTSDASPSLIITRV